MARRRHRHKKLHITYNEKVIYLISLIVTLILSLMISTLLKKNLSFFKHQEKDVPYTGSAVRKESIDRQNYEKYYREKQAQWSKEYQDILRNNEEITELEELEIETKKKK